MPDGSLTVTLPSAYHGEHGVEHGRLPGFDLGEITLETLSHRFKLRTIPDSSHLLQARR